MKKWLGGLLCLLLVVSMFTGCKAGEQPAAVTATDAPPAEEIVPGTTAEPVAEALEGLAKAASLFVEGKTDEALQLVRESVLTDPTQGENALAMLKEWAAGGNADVLYLLGDSFENGAGIPGDLTEALAWYEKAAGAGSAEALYRLGYLYCYGGDGLEANVEKGLSFLKQSAEKGDTAAMTQLGRYFSDLADTAGAKEWFEKAAEKGDLDAMRSLGYLFESAADNTNAAKWYQKAAEAGDPSAMLSLAGLMDLEKNTYVLSGEEVMKWLKAAAEQTEDVWSQATAQADIGFHYLDGESVEQNTEEAVKWLTLAAKNNEWRAVPCIGACYEYGVCVEKSLEEAESWYQLSIENGGNQALVDSYRSRIATVAGVTPDEAAG